MSIDIQNAQEAEIMESIISDTTLGEFEVEVKVKRTRRERRAHKQSSFNTIFNISNTMMGSALLVMANNFYFSGMISSILAALVMGFVSYYTADLIIAHSKDEEIDYPEAIQRILGKPWPLVFNLTSAILLYLGGLVHFVLMSEVLYALLKNIISGSQNLATKDEITFNNFSMQYIGLIVFIICTLLFSIKQLKGILKVNDKGLYMILVFCLFTIYIGIDALFRSNISFQLTGDPGKINQGLTITLFTPYLITLNGIFSLAYLMHNAITGIMKNNKDSSKNSRDLKISYTTVFVAYVILGVFGCFAVAALYNAIYNMLLRDKKNSFNYGFTYER